MPILVGWLGVDPSYVHLAFDDTPDGLLLLLLDLLLGHALEALLVCHQQPLLLGQLHRLQSVLGHHRKVLDRLIIPGGA